MIENEAVEELKENLELPFGSNISDEASRMAMKALEEIQQYRAIGTIEECREASERQRAKKPSILNKEKVISQGQMFVANHFKCPNCGINQAYFDGIPKYCDNCGQKLEEGVTE